MIAAGFDGGLPVRRAPMRPAVPAQARLEPVAPVVAAVAAPIAAPVTEAVDVVEEPVSEVTSSRSWLDPVEDQTEEEENYFAGLIPAEEVEDTATRAIPVVEPQESTGDYGDDLDIPDFLK